MDEMIVELQSLIVAHILLIFFAPMPMLVIQGLHEEILRPTGGYLTLLVSLLTQLAVELVTDAICIFIELRYNNLSVLQAFRERPIYTSLVEIFACISSIHIMFWSFNPTLTA